MTLLREDGQVDRRVSYIFDDEGDGEPRPDEAAGDQPLPAGVQLATPTNLRVLHDFVADAAAEKRLAARQTNQLPQDADDRVIAPVGNEPELQRRLATLRDNFRDNKEQTAAYESLVGDDAKSTVVSGEGEPRAPATPIPAECFV